MNATLGANGPLSTASVVGVLEAHRITHVAGIPDNTSAPLFDALASHPTIALVTVSREGEAIALACGVWVGGGRPLVVVQNTGLLESGDAIRGTAARMGVPIPILVTARGYRKLQRAGLGPDALGAPPDPDGSDRPAAPREWPDLDLLRDPAIDSIALHTEATLRAWGIPYTVDDGSHGPGSLSSPIEDARRREHPTAHLLTHPLA
jgi:hypothetical protein